ncbi:PREDICTED: WD repeat-containing protein RUP2 [Nicotiana attenuata]|uniref:Wd repeat-containing protein rup2 n=1 Tax=Nicotiana attenuata TaxID=49451 RepID=A0A314KH21_NICAT|nr:PREDICTED: WD repeat-containing protein RUP2 [Nicotiana attenuata]OIT28552.1 wd repeat-containing protein rup2 [Nicotiana attenuata]
MTDISSRQEAIAEIQVAEGEEKLGSELVEREEEDDEKARSEWDFHLSTFISNSCNNSINGSACDTLGVLEFDPSGNFLASGGIARKIRIYNVNSLLQEGREGGRLVSLDHGNACNFYMCTPAKLSSLKWKPGWGSRVLGSGDYDGVVMEYDLEKKMPVFERDEHGGRRVWSIDYCHSDPVLGASGSDDGTMQMWDPRCGDDGKCLAMVQPSKQCNPVCCVEFNPFKGPIVAVGCADRRVYAYDVRKMTDPLFVLDGHQKAVTYIRFLDERTIVSSSVDGCLKMWDTENQHVIRTYKGHDNSRRFVGLSVWRPGGLICCGSESNQVYVYDKRWGEPIWVYGRESMGVTGYDHGFVSSVCWQQKEDNRCTLVAGDSDGVLRVFSGKRR